MYVTHKAKDGKTMLIAEMDDDHLANTVSLLIKRLKEINAMIDGEY